MLRVACVGSETTLDVTHVTLGLAAEPPSALSSLPWSAHVVVALSVSLTRALRVPDVRVVWTHASPQPVHLHTLELSVTAQDVVAPVLTLFVPPIWALRAWVDSALDVAALIAHIHRLDVRAVSMVGAPTGAAAERLVGAWPPNVTLCFNQSFVSQWFAEEIIMRHSTNTDAWSLVMQRSALWPARLCESLPHVLQRIQKGEIQIVETRVAGGVSISRARGARVRDVLSSACGALVMRGVMDYDILAAWRRRPTLWARGERLDEDRTLEEYGVDDDTELEIRE